MPLRQLLETDHGADRSGSDRQLVEADGPREGQLVPRRRQVRADRKAVAQSRPGRQPRGDGEQVMATVRFLC